VLRRACFLGNFGFGPTKKSITAWLCSCRNRRHVSRPGMVTVRSPPPPPPSRATQGGRHRLVAGRRGILAALATTKNAFQSRQGLSGILRRTNNRAHQAASARRSLPGLFCKRRETSCALIVGCRLVRRQHASASARGLGPNLMCPLQNRFSHPGNASLRRVRAAPPAAQPVKPPIVTPPTRRPDRRLASTCPQGGALPMRVMAIIRLFMRLSAFLHGRWQSGRHDGKTRAVQSSITSR